LPRCRHTTRRSGAESGGCGRRHGCQSGDHLRAGLGQDDDERSGAVGTWLHVMSDESPIINKVASSGIITLDLEEIYPQGERVVFDLKPLLWQEIALKEDDLRAFVKNHDWSAYKGKFVSVHCSADAIIPTWA